MRSFGWLRCFVAGALCFGCASLCAGSEADVLAHWAFDETSGTDVLDASGRGRHATIVGAVRRVAGVTGGALEFPGTKEAYVSCANKDGHFDTTAALTIEAWVKRADTGTLSDGLVCNSGPAPEYQHGGYQLLFGEKQQQRLVLQMRTDAQGSGSIAGEYVPVNEWTHIVATFDAGRGMVELYQDGRRTASRRRTGNVDVFSGQLMIGKSEKLNAFRGIIDEVRLYGRALSAAEILGRYRALRPPEQAPPQAPPPVCFKNLTAKLTTGGVALAFAKTEALPVSGQAQDAARVQIFRSCCERNDFTPGVKSAERVFEGTLRSSETGEFEYLVPQAPEPGRTCHFWISPDGANFRAGSAKVRSFHPEIWWKPARIETEMRRIAETWPGRTRIVRVGETVQGRPLNALFAGNGQRRVVLVGAMHVAESGPELILPAIEGLLRDCPELLDKVGVAALPCVTMDGRTRMIETGHAAYLRLNANGIDLNRNFTDYQGDVETSAARARRKMRPGLSEPETRAVAELLRQANPAAVFSFHSIGSLCNADFVCANEAVFAGDSEIAGVCKAVARAYAEGMYPGEADKYFRYAETRGREGRLSTYVYRNYRAPSFDLELDANERPRALVYSDRLTVDLLREYQQRHQKAVESVLRGFADGKLVRLPAKPAASNE